MTTEIKPFTKRSQVNTAIKRLEQLKPLVDEYNTLRDRLKITTEGQPEFETRDYIIKGRYQHRKAFEMPASTYWSWKPVKKPKNVNVSSLLTAIK